MAETVAFAYHKCTFHGPAEIASINCPVAMKVRVDSDMGLHRPSVSAAAAVQYRDTPCDTTVRKLGCCAKSTRTA